MRISAIARNWISTDVVGGKLAATFSLILMCAPRLNVKIGPVPVYFIDFVVLGMLLCALNQSVSARDGSPSKRLIQAIFCFALFSEIKTFYLSGGSAESVYTILRTMLAFSVFYSISNIARTPAVLSGIFKAVAIALVVNSILMILTSLPMTRPLVGFLFTASFLEPAAERPEIFTKVIEVSDSAVRGRTLVGVSILAATFSNVAWPLAALLPAWPGCSKLWRLVANGACLLAPVGVLMSYSRGPIIGTILVVLVALLQTPQIRSHILAPVIACFALVAIVGVGSQLFFFERLVNRTDVILAGNFHDERESERLYAYTEPFEHAFNNPQYLLLGDGINPERAGVEGVAREASTHALFASAYYAYGMVAAFLLVFLVLAALTQAARNVKMRHKEPIAGLSQALLACVVAMLPWFAFGHAMITSPSGSMLLFFVLGMLGALQHMPPPRRSSRARIAAWSIERNSQVPKLRQYDSVNS